MGELRTCQLGSTSTLAHIEIRDANMTFRCPESGPALCVDRAAAPTGPTACQGLSFIWRFQPEADPMIFHGFHVVNPMPSSTYVEIPPISFR
jgi:hypothetical protein